MRKWHQQATYHITNANDEIQFEVADYVQQRDNIDPATYIDGGRDVAPGRYKTSPITSPTMRPDHLRLSYMDDLAPVTERDYRPAPLLELRMLQPSHTSAHSH